MTNCSNCGAPITNDICAYCGTVFINPKEYEDLKKELQNNIFRASLAEQNMALINSLTGILSANEVRGLFGFKPVNDSIGEVGRSTWSALV